MRIVTLSIVGPAVLAACTSMHTTQESRPSASPGSGKTVAKRAEVFPYAVQRATLDNGLKVLMVPMPAGGLVSYWSIVRTGSRDEVEEGVTGFAHFFEHMMFRGTDKLPGPEYDKIVNGMGADANAYTTDDYTAYHLSFAKEDLPKVVEIEADRFQNLKYDAQQFRKESGAVYGEYRKGRTSPFEVLDEAARSAAFDQHTYKHTTIGFEADIQRMPEQFDYSKGFFQRFYRPENVVILVTGDFDPAKALALVKQQYGGWRTGYTAPKVPVEPPQAAQRRIDVPFDGKTLPMLALNFKGEAFKPGDRLVVAAALVGELAFGETSRLYKKLVLDEQRVDSLFASFDPNRDPGLWGALAMVKDAGDVKAVEQEMWDALTELRRAPVDSRRLDAVRSNLKYGFLSRMGTAQGAAESLARYVAITGDLACVDQMFATLDGVTPEDVRKAADTWLRPERCTVALLHSREQPPEPIAKPAEAKDASASAPGAASAHSREQPAEGAAQPAEAKDASASLSDAASSRVTQAPVLLPEPRDPEVAFKIWFQVGSQDDPPGKEGLAALTAALISEGGTEKLPYDRILEQLFPMAAGYTVRVDKEMTVVSGSAHVDNVERYYGYLVDAVTKPGFRKDDFERLRDQAVSDIENELRYSSDEELGKAALVEKVFAGTPYGHLDRGTVASLGSITVDDVRAFWKAHFTRDNVVIGLGGAVPKELPDKLAADLGRLQSGKPEAVPAPKAAEIRGRRLTLVEKDGPSTAISFGCPIDVRRGSREFYALWIANSWLGEHRNSSSHLYQVIRETRGMNYGDYSYIEAFPRGGRLSMPPTGVGRRQQMFEVWIRPVPRENTLFALRAALREVEMLAKNGLTKEQFEFTKRFLKGYCLHFAESAAERLGYAIDDRYYGLKESHLATFRRMMDEITLDEVNAAIRKHIQAENLQIAMVTADAADMKARIASDAPSPIGYPKGVTNSPEMQAEDKTIEGWPLKVPEANIAIVPVSSMFAGAKPRATQQ